MPRIKLALILKAPLASNIVIQEPPLVIYIYFFNSPWKPLIWPGFVCKEAGTVYKSWKIAAPSPRPGKRHQLIKTPNLGISKVRPRGLNRLLKEPLPWRWGLTTVLSRVGSRPCIKSRPQTQPLANHVHVLLLNENRRTAREWRPFIPPLSLDFTNQQRRVAKPLPIENNVGGCHDDKE